MQRRQSRIGPKSYTRWPLAPPRSECSDRNRFGMNEKDRIELDLPQEVDGAAVDAAEKERVHFLDLLIVLAKHGKFLMIFVVVATVICTIVSLVLPVRYTAKTEILPPQ